MLRQGLKRTDTKPSTKYRPFINKSNECLMGMKGFDAIYRKLKLSSGSMIKSTEITFYIRCRGKVNKEETSLLVKWIIVLLST